MNKILDSTVNLIPFFLCMLFVGCTQVGLFNHQFQKDGYVMSDLKNMRRHEMISQAYYEKHYTAIAEKRISAEWLMLEQDNDAITGFWVLHNDKHDKDYNVKISANPNGTYYLSSVDGTALSAIGNYSVEESRLIQDNKIKSQMHTFVPVSEHQYIIEDGKYAKSTLTKIGVVEEITLNVPTVKSCKST